MRPAPVGFTGLALIAAQAVQLAGAFSISPITDSSAAAKKLVRRENSTQVPAAINIAPSQYWDGIDGPWSSFPVQIGASGQAQVVRVFVSTVAYNTWTIGASGCPAGAFVDCQDSRGSLFLPNESVSWTPNSVYDLEVEMNLGLDTSGSVGFDTVTLGWQGSGGPSMPSHSIVFNLNDYKPSWLGMFGVNPLPTNFTNFVDPQLSFMQYAYDNSIIPSIAYGYTAGNQYQLDGLDVYGSLVLGGYDQNRFSNNGITFPMGADISRDLLVNLKSISTDKGSPSNLLPSGNIEIFIDSTVSTIWLPQDACEAFESAFGITYDDTSGYYLVTAEQRQNMLDQDAKVTFTVQPTNSTGSDNTVDIVLPYGAFDLNISYPYIGNNNTASSLYFPLRRAANDTQYTLGRTFLQEAYLFSDYQRGTFSVSQCVWNASTINQQDIKSILSPNLTETTNSSGTGDSSSLSGGAIGGVVVGVAGVVAILGGVLYVLRRRKNKRQKAAELEAKSVAAGTTSETTDAQDSDGKPFISRPLGGELGGGELHELNAPHKHFAQELDSPYKMNDPNKHGYSEMEGGEYFAPGKNGRAHEMPGSETPIYEMAGSEVQELPVPQNQAERK